LRQVFGEQYDYQNNLVSSWAGIRPLVKETEEDRNLKAKYLGFETDPARFTLLQRASSLFKRGVIRFGYFVHGKGKDAAAATKAISRNHVIEFSKNDLVSVMGGKWTTFR
jgi:glycerol-3-phosphate dehydrogenase